MELTDQIQDQFSQVSLSLVILYYFSSFLHLFPFSRWYRIRNWLTVGSSADDTRVRPAPPVRSSWHWHCSSLSLSLSLFFSLSLSHLPIPLPFSVVFRCQNIANLLGFGGDRWWPGNWPKHRCCCPLIGLTSLDPIPFISPKNPPADG